MDTKDMRVWQIKKWDMAKKVATKLEDTYNISMEDFFPFPGENKSVYFVWKNPTEEHTHVVEESIAGISIKEVSFDDEQVKKAYEARLAELASRPKVTNEDIAKALSSKRMKFLFFILSITSKLPKLKKK